MPANTYGTECDCCGATAADGRFFAFEGGARCADHLDADAHYVERDVADDRTADSLAPAMAAA